MSRQSSARNYIISCIDDCSRKVASKFFERKRSIDVLDVLEEWIMINGKPKRIMHDNGKQFTSNMFEQFLEYNYIKDKPIPNSYPQLQGKIEAYNKIVKNEFIPVEQISSIDEGKVRYDMFVKEYNDKREHGGINGLAPSEMSTTVSHTANLSILITWIISVQARCTLNIKLSNLTLCTRVNG